MDPTDPLCIVPARGTSPGLPKKHFKRLAGKPVVAHTVETALDCPGIEEVVASTEDDALADLAREYGARTPFRRPDRLVGDGALLHEVVSHAVDQLRGERPVTPETPVVVLQPNVPFRRVRDVETAIERFRAGHEAVVSVAEERRFFWAPRDAGDGTGRSDGADGAPGEATPDVGEDDEDPELPGGRLEPRFAERALRAELEPFYRETGSINVTSTALLERDTRVGEAPGYVLTDRLSSLSIDSVVDLWLAERLAEGPRVVFRVDGGGDRGMGHVSRCLTLAGELERTLRASSTFVSDARYRAGARAVREAGYDARLVDADPLGAVAACDPDLVFLDVLDTDPDRVRDLHRTAAAVVNLEDLAGGPAHADLVVNALYEPELAPGATASASNHLAGAEYFVLREEFRDRPAAVPETVERGLLTFGGSDPAGLSATAVRAVASDGRTWRVVRGPDFDTDLDAALAAAPNVTAVTDPEMGPLMEWADLAVCSGGRTAYELAATGTPTLVLAQNDREHERMTALADRGVVAYLGRGDGVDADGLRAAVDDLAADPDRRRALADRAREFVDGAGTRRVLDAVHEALLG